MVVATYAGFPRHEGEGRLTPVQQIHAGGVEAPPCAENVRLDRPRRERQDTSDLLGHEMARDKAHDLAFAFGQGFERL